MKKVFLGSVVSILLGAGIIDYCGLNMVGISLMTLGCVGAIFSAVAILAGIK